ncbi:MAG TPA: undecaprenyl-phosphate glucose phosphotransferase [Planctomycetota bacterium]|nr:undecaprenyl-phosphate glucose phosphotransferase [Planctomycetota bacterium]
MTKRSRHTFFTLALIFDAVLVTAAWLGCYVVRFSLRLETDVFAYFTRFVEILPIILLCDFVALGFVGLYRPPRARSPFGSRVKILQGAAIGWLLMLAVLYFYTEQDEGLYSRVLLGLFLFANPAALMLSRVLVMRVMRALHRRGWGVRRVAIVGTGRLAQKVLHGLRNDPWQSVHVEYFLTEDDERRRETVHGVEVAASTSRLQETLAARPVDSVFVAIPASKAEKREHVLDALAKLPVTIAVIPDFKGVVTLNTSVDEIDGLPVIQLVDSPIQGWNAVAKRVIDLVGAIVLLVIFALPMLVIALWVKLTSAGPVFFRQTRMGLGGKPFTMLKFRTMHVGAEKETGPVWAVRDDPRCTPIGRRLRRTSLDELPQLFNVLIGTMSLVGPRPERPHFVEEFVETVPAYMLRHNVKAGMTGWAQINGLRGDTSLRRRLQYDLYYLDNWSLGFDLYILLKTPIVGFLNKNAH